MAQLDHSDTDSHIFLYIPLFNMNINQSFYVLSLFDVKVGAHDTNKNMNKQ